MRTPNSNEVPYSAGFYARHAKDAAHDYLIAGVSAIDEKFGTGFAKKNPQLLAAYVEAASREFQTGFLGQKIEELSKAVLNNGAISAMDAVRLHALRSAPLLCRLQMGVAWRQCYRKIKPCATWEEYQADYEIILDALGTGPEAAALEDSDDA